MPDRYTVKLAGPVRRAVQNETIPIPFHVADALYTLMNGGLSENPYRCGGELDPPYEGKWSAHLAREWRVVYKIDEPNRLVTVTAVRRRADVYGVR